MYKNKVCYILIIDDEVPILKMLKLKLVREGFEVDIAESGKKAIQKIDSSDYDLILTDIKMPGISGDQILHYIKSEKGSSLPVVGMSGTPWLLEQNDFNAVLTKPCTMKEMLEVIKQFTTEPLAETIIFFKNSFEKIRFYFFLNLFFVFYQKKGLWASFKT